VPVPATVPAGAPAPAPAAAPGVVAPVPAPAVAPDAGDEGRHDSARTGSGDHLDDHTPPQPHPVQAPTGRRRARREDAPATGPDPDPEEERGAVARDGDTGSVPLPAEAPVPHQPLPAERADAARADATAEPDPDSTQGRAFSVRTLGQGVPFAQQMAQPSGRRRKLGNPSDAERAAAPAAETPARPHPQPGTPPQQRLAAQSEGRAYAIGAPDEDAAEGPEPLDGPGGAVEVANKPAPQPVDDELPPEPLDNPRRLLVWPAPDVSTQQALSDRGYRPVIVHSREEVDAQIAAFPAALFVDPLTGPITRTALQSLRQAAVAAEVPVLLAAGLGQATREAAYGADPAVLLKALAPRDSEQHPSRVLLIEEQEEIATALTATLERRGMQVARAATDADAVATAQQVRPNLVVMDLMQVRRRRAGIIDWLRANGQLNRTPLVVYTSAELDQAELPGLSSGETVLFLAERSTSAEVQTRIVDLLAKIGTN
ncbi:PAS domain S-box protein, partial [Streptomyces sp. NPDC001941]